MHWAPKGNLRSIPARYERKGILNLLAVRDERTGEVFGDSYEKKTHRDFLNFLEKVERRYKGERLFIILDNLSSHKHRKVKEWLKEHELITLVFLPTNASWLNHIEPYFKDVKRFVINGSNYVSKKEMKKALRGYIKWTNKMIKLKQKVKGNYLKQ